MRNKLPILKTNEVLRILLKLGFQPRRKKGSHLILAKNNKRIVIPIHEGRDIPKGTLLNIIKQAGLTKKEFLKRMKQDRYSSGSLKQLPKSPSLAPHQCIGVRVGQFLAPYRICSGAGLFFAREFFSGFYFNIIQ